MKRVKKIFLTYCMFVIAVLCAVFFLVPAFAEMKMFDETELAGMNVSVTGAAIKDRTPCIEKDGICLETKQDPVAMDKGAAVPNVAEVDNTTVFMNSILNIGGREAFSYGMSASYSNRTGGAITSIQTR